jgi:hypothetical protein
MDIKYRLTPQDSDALAQALALRGERGSVLMTCGAVVLVTLVMIIPIRDVAASWPMLVFGIVAAIIAALLTWWVTRLWLKQRARLFPPPPVRGLEPGQRRLTLALENVREISAEGERVFRWQIFAGRAETDKWVALRVSSRECLAIPRAALRKGDFGGAGPLMSLLRSGRGLG